MWSKQENGVIHRNPQLQYRRQRFCNVTDLAKENVTSQIIYNRYTYTDQEKNRYQEGFSGNFQHQRKKKEKSSGRNIWTDGEYRRTFDGKGSF